MESVIRFVEERVAGLADRRRKVWFERNGSPYDFRAVDVLGARFVVHGIAAVRFNCPRCGKKHESLLFA